MRSRCVVALGFSPTTPASVKTRTVEIKVRGYAKPITSTYTLKEDGRYASDGRPLGGSCKPA